VEFISIKIVEGGFVPLSYLKGAKMDEKIEVYIHEIERLTAENERLRNIDQMNNESLGDKYREEMEQVIRDLRIEKLEYQRMNKEIAEDLVKTRQELSKITKKKRLFHRK
jgi:hypothetical protein